MHDAAPAAARASLAAQRQGKFWEMHDALFEQPERVANREFSAIAKEVGLDVGRFERDLEDPSIVLAVERDMEDGRELGIRGTPSIVVGDKLVIGAQPLATLREVVDAELARAG
jgi:protein-disulfide isomerase